MAVRLYPLCFARRVTAPQAPLTTAAALPIHSSTGKVSIVVSLHDPSYFSLGLIRRLTCYRAAKFSTRFPQKTGLLRRFPAAGIVSGSPIGGLHFAQPARCPPTTLNACYHVVLRWLSTCEMP